MQQEKEILHFSVASGNFQGEQQIAWGPNPYVTEYCWPGDKHRLIIRILRTWKILKTDKCLKVPQFFLNSL